ncbi:MAG: hypothetical protein AB2L07_02825 [Thermoanaerobaculaceae bacterium]
MAIAYAVLDQPDPLAAACSVARGYHAAFPLEEDELAVLWSLATLRLCMSACIAAEQQAARPDDPYLGISQGPIRRTLPAARRHPARGGRGGAADGVRAAAARQVPRHRALARGPTPRRSHRCWARTCGRRRSSCSTSASPARSSRATRLATPSRTSARGSRGRCRRPGARIGVGRYGEARYLYTSPVFATAERPTDETRTVHLGIDPLRPARDARARPAAGDRGGVRRQRRAAGTTAR